MKLRSFRHAGVVTLGLLLLGLPSALHAQFTFTTQNGTATITGYTGPGGAVTIPSTLAGLPVTAIGNGAFEYQQSINSVTIPGSVTRIGGVAFEGCHYLTNVTMGNGITIIGDSAFDTCSRLASIMIPASVTNIGSSPFNDCYTLVGINVDAQNLFYSSTDGVLFDKAQTTLIQYPVAKPNGSYSIPGSVTSIGNAAFSGCYFVTNVTIPGSVTLIGDGAFYLSPLASVLIPGSVTNIGANAFGWSGLTQVTLLDGVTSIPGTAFASCRYLSNVALPNSLTSIGNAAFQYDTNLTSITIPGSVNNIGDYAFYECSHLTNVYCKGDAPNYGAGTFDSPCTTVYYLPGTAGWASTFGGRPTMLWNPEPQTAAPDFGVRNNRFGFSISGTPNIPIVIEACSNPGHALWQPLQTCTLTNGSLYFSDPTCKDYPARLYRIRSP